MRDNVYLNWRLEYIWDKYFSDQERLNKIIIRFGKSAEKRLGSIRRANKTRRNFDSLILINGHFRDQKIPDYVIDATIAHELVHYIHGFSSPLPKLSPFPHRGGKIEKEMQKRNIGRLAKIEALWLEENWLNYLRSLKVN